MQSLSIALVDAVQDLYDLYLRLAPIGPYRMELFHERKDPGAEWPEQLRRAALGIDTLLRGASCLLANQLAPASIPLCAGVLKELRRLRMELGESGPEPEYYNYLGYELTRRGDGSNAMAYRLFGEVLALYLDLLCIYGPPGALEHLPRISLLRSALV